MNEQTTEIKDKLGITLGGKEPGANQVDKLRMKLDRITTPKVTTDPAMNIVKPGNDMEITGNFNYRAKQMHDVFYHKLSLWIRNNPKKAKLYYFQSKSLEELLGVHLEELLTLLPPISFTDSEFRDITGLRHLSGEDIKGIAEEYSKVRLDGVFYIADDGKKWTEYSIHSHIAGIIIEESGDYSIRGEKPIFRYCIGWNLLTFLLFHNLLHERFTLWGKDFYKLEGGQQNLIRYIRQFKNSKLGLEEISGIIGYDKSVEELSKFGIQDRIRSIGDKLESLRRNKYIHSWRKKPGTKGRQTVFIINRVAPKKDK